MPEKKGYDNFLYCFDTENCNWYRITSADKDGNYEKVIMDNRIYPDFPTESSDNVFKTFDGSLIVCGREDDRLNIVEDDTYDDTYSDNIAESSPEVKQAI
ncbi:MAG: hypothetical protein AB7S75_11595 [Desulfococcaceae bacterium]